VTFDWERRALLGLAVGLPLVGCSGGAGASLRGKVEGAVFAAAPPPPFGRSPSPSELGEELWARALAAFREAEAAVEECEARSRGLPFAEAEVFEEEHGRLSDLMYEALRGLLGTAAPDGVALAVKMDLVVAHEVGSLAGGEACLEAVRGDAWRLAGRLAGRAAPPLAGAEGRG